MTLDNFIDGIYQECIIEQLKTYRTLLENTSNATDPTWIGIIGIYKKLNIEEKKSFIDFLRVVEVNTIASFLSIMDGDKPINGDFITFELRPERGEAISENLTYKFLEKDDLV